MQPSFSGLFVTCAYFPHTTLPPFFMFSFESNYPNTYHSGRNRSTFRNWKHSCVTKPNSEMLTSMTVPLVMTPKLVNIGLEGFFFTPIIGKQKVAFNSGCVTWAFLNRIAIGLMKRSYFGIFRVKSSGTKHTFVTILFHAFFWRFPDFIILKTSASAWARTRNEF